MILSLLWKGIDSIIVDTFGIKIHFKIIFGFIKKV